MPACRRIRLEPLSPGDHAQLVDNLLGLDAPLGRELVERTSGNPLFAVALVGDWVERGVLDARAGGFVLKDGESAPLPRDLMAVWQARVERLLAALPAGNQLSLALAAQLGNEVDHDEWREACALLGSPAPDALCAALHGARLGLPGEGTTCWVHGMLREAIVRAASAWIADTACHAAVADALLAKYGADRGASERILRHVLFAGRLADARPHLVRAFRNRVDLGEHAAAHVLSERHEQVLRDLSVAAGDELWSECWLGRAWLLRREARFDEAQELAARCAELAERHAWGQARVHALAELGDLAMRRGDTMLGLMYLQSALNAHAGDDDVVVARCSWTLGWVRMLRGEHAGASRLFSRSLAASAGEDGWLTRVHALWSLGRAAGDAGDFERAESLCESAEKEARRSGSRLGVAHALVSLAEVSLLRGDAARAVTLAAQALELFGALGSGEAWRAELSLALGLAESIPAQAVERADLAVEKLAGAGRTGFEAMGHAVMTACATAAGEWERAERALDAFATLEGKNGVTGRILEVCLEQAALRGADAGRVGFAETARRLAAEQRRRLAAGAAS